MDDSISRQAVLDAMGERPLVWDEWVDEYELGQRNQYDADKLAVETVPSAEPHWISVREKLPVESGYYLVTDAYGEVVLASWFKYDFDDEEPQWWLAEYGSIEVVAWMPLPEPYRGR